MLKFLLAAVSAGALAAAVPSAQTPRAATPETRPEYTVEPEGEGGLALEALENLLPEPGGAPNQIMFALVGDGILPGADSPSGEMESWQVQILDSSGRKVGFIQGSGEHPPPFIPWAGTDPAGKPLPGGFYSARLVWLDGANRVHSARPVNFNLFSQLQMPKFAELKLDFRFAGGFPDL